MQLLAQDNYAEALKRGLMQVTLKGRDGRRVAITDGTSGQPGHLRIDRRKLITPTATHALTGDEAKLLLLLQEKGPRKASKLRAHREVLERLAAQDVVRWTFPVAISHDPLKSLPQTAEVIDVKARLAALTSPLGVNGDERCAEDGTLR